MLLLLLSQDTCACVGVSASWESTSDPLQAVSWPAQWDIFVVDLSLPQACGISNLIALIFTKHVFYYPHFIDEKMRV